MVLAGRFLRTADLGALVCAALRHEGPVWGSRAAAMLILANDRLGPFAPSRWPADHDFAKVSILRIADLGA